MTTHVIYITDNIDKVGSLWRLDRKLEQQLLCNKKSIKEAIESLGFKTIECFDGGPYIEKDNQDNFAFYKQTYYIGKRKGKI